MLSSSRIVFAEDLGVATPWRPGALEGERRAGAERRVAPERRTDALPAGPSYEDGLRDGYARGLEESRLEGEAARRSEIEAIAQRADARTLAASDACTAAPTTGRTVQRPAPAGRRWRRRTAAATG
jgi:hypothetical protein